MSECSTVSLAFQEKTKTSVELQQRWCACRQSIIKAQNQGCGVEVISSRRFWVESDS